MVTTIDQLWESDEGDDFTFSADEKSPNYDKIVNKELSKNIDLEKKDEFKKEGEYDLSDLEEKEDIINRISELRKRRFDNI